VIVGSGPSSIPRPGGILGFYLPSRERWYHDSIASPTAAQSHDIAISILMLSGKFLSVALRILFQAANMISPSLLKQKMKEPLEAPLLELFVSSLTPTFAGSKTLLLIFDMTRFYTITLPLLLRYLNKESEGREYCHQMDEVLNSTFLFLISTLSLLQKILWMFIL